MSETSEASSGIFCTLPKFEQYVEHATGQAALSAPSPMSNRAKREFNYFRGAKTLPMEC